MKRNVLEYLEARVRAHPKKTSVDDGQVRLRWEELLDLSQRVGSGLLPLTARRDPVAVLAEKSAATLGLFLGIVQAGCFYVLLNPDLPPARLQQVQAVLGAKRLITDEQHYDLARQVMPEESILLAKDLAETPADPAALAAVRQQTMDTDPLYANFTSGSTGVPKGVVVSHRSVLDFIDCFVPLFGIDQEDVLACQAPFDFDVSVKDIYAALKTGATLILLPKQLFSTPAALVDRLCECQVTTLIWAVSALCLVSSFHGLDYRTPTSVKRVLFSGEEMPRKALETWMRHLPQADFVNLYGPTEITCNCTYHRVDRTRDYAEGLPIGRPFPNEGVFLLDEQGREITTPGQVGELCVRGTALALGYLNAPEQTARAFCQNPLNPHYPERIYRTGDLACYNQRQELLFRGRKDFQVKYLGHRVELEEVERAVAQVPGVERCCVVFADHRLYGFYTGQVERKALHHTLRQSLPAYMVPGALYPLPTFPLTKNGKVDRKKLLEMRRQS